jgi:predicted enzyme related to lactoylglutathione lyase
MKKRVTGLGGIFFKTQNRDTMRAWYARHLGIESESWGGQFEWRDKDYPEKLCLTAWSPFDGATDYFQPSEKEFMINYRVENLVDLLNELKKEGVEVLGEIQEFDYGKFGWIMDPEGRKIELWEPIDAPILKGNQD